jgi:hypothetical protein
MAKTQYAIKTVTPEIILNSKPVVEPTYVVTGRLLHNGKEYNKGDIFLDLTVAKELLSMKVLEEIK